MTSQTHNTPLLNWQHPPTRRWVVLAIVLALLLVMGFYTLTDSSRLAHTHLLAGADWTGYAVCHRITDRSFTINGRQLPLCARCTGMYLGVSLTLIVLWLAGRSRHSELPPLPILLILAGFIGIMGIDGINSYSHFFPQAPHLYEPRNWLRLLTGMGTGLAMGIIILPALNQTLWYNQNYRPSVGSLRELAGLLVMAGTAVLLVLSNQPIILYVLALISTAGIVAILTALNTILLLIVWRRDGQAQTWSQTAVPLLISLILALIEISVISMIRFNLTGTMTGFAGLS